MRYSTGIDVGTTLANPDHKSGEIGISREIAPGLTWALLLTFPIMKAVKWLFHEKYFWV